MHRPNAIVSAILAGIIAGVLTAALGPAGRGAGPSPAATSHRATSLLSRPRAAAPGLAAPASRPTTPPPPAAPRQASAPVPPPDVTVTIDQNSATLATRLITGVTLTQHALDPWDPAAAVSRGTTQLGSLGGLEDQAIMGWGATNPEPSPGQFDWQSLDRRVQLMRATGGTPVLTLCCAPDWMKGGQPGTTDWSRLEVAPAANHDGDFAALARQVALRYPDVRHYLVWNELKGFWNASLNRWDYEGYTSLYNAVYTALKQVDPGIQVGGPYVPLLSGAAAATMSNPSALRGPWGVMDQRSLDVLTYWHTHAVGADFVVVDGSTATQAQTYVPDAFGAADKLAAMTTWVAGALRLPVWWAEWYAVPASQQTDLAPRHTAAVLANALLELMGSGAGAALGWQPEGDPSLCGACLWTSAASAAGAQPSDWGRTYAAITHAIPPGAPLLRTRSSDPRVAAVATRGTVILINRSGLRLRVSVGATTVSMSPDDVTVVAAG